MSDKIKRSVQRQFGDVAAHYRDSAVHARGEDLPVLVEQCRLNGVERVLDAGCGAGHTALAVAPHAAQVVAYDFTPAMLQQVRRLADEREVDNVETRQGDVESLDSCESGSFDRVVSRYSGHHWQHPRSALAAFARVLKPGGVVVISDVIAPDDPAQDTFLQTVELLRDPSHVRDHSIPQWLDMLAGAGFQAGVVYRWPLRLDFDAWTQRMATPAQHVAMIKTLFDGAPEEVRAAFQVGDDGSFVFPGAILRGVLGG